tara:strand:+ start:6539 stop:7429 length:891 start_codon:yes stop_codon:yes gene_type:complete
MKNKTVKLLKYNKMNCSPMVNKNKTFKNSCFDKTSLLYIKDSYNKHHPNDQIEGKQLNKILSELKEKLSKCSREDCWLKEIKNIDIQKKIYDFVFAPKQPSDWKKNPATWLSNYDILEVLKQYEKTYKHFKFIGPTPIDFDNQPYNNDKCVWQELCDFSIANLKKQGKNKIGIIFNLDKHDQPGSHWVSMFIDLTEKYIYYMDSALNTIPSEINLLINKIKNQDKSGKKFKFYANTIEHQMGNNECGMYSLFFIITMLTGKVKNKNLDTLRKKINFFNKRIPDKYVFNYRNIYFNS